MYDVHRSSKYERWYKMKIDKKLIGGSSILLVLTLLDEKDMYGYQIIKEIEIRSDDTFQFKEGSLYPVLHKLHNKGHIKSYAAKGETGKTRKYYQLTNSGRKHLKEEKEQWVQFSSSVNKVIGGNAHAYA